MIPTINTKACRAIPDGAKAHSLPAEENICSFSDCLNTPLAEEKEKGESLKAKGVAGLWALDCFGYVPSVVLTEMEALTHKGEEKIGGSESGCGTNSLTILTDNCETSTVGSNNSLILGDKKEISGAVGKSDFTEDIQLELNKEISDPALMEKAVYHPKSMTNSEKTHDLTRNLIKSETKNYPPDTYRTNYAYSGNSAQGAESAGKFMMSSDNINRIEQDHSIKDSSGMKKAKPEADTTDTQKILEEGDKSVVSDMSINFTGVYSGKESAIGAVQSRNMISQVVRSVAHMTENAKRSLTIELMPAELGKIKVKMEYNKGRLELKMHAEKDMTANALINRLPELKISFEAVNIDIQSIDIGTAGGFEFFDQAGLAHEDYRRGEGGDADLYLREGVKDTADIHSHAPNGAGYHSNHLVDYIA